MNDPVEVFDSDEDDYEDYDLTYDHLPGNKEIVPTPSSDHVIKRPQHILHQQDANVQPLSPYKTNNSTETKQPGKPSVPCPHCPKLFMRAYNMKVHIDRVHNKSKPWQCQFCEKTFATTSDLKQHLSSHGMGKIHKVR